MASARRVPTCNGAAPPPAAPLTLIWRKPVRAGSQVKPTVGNTMESCVALAVCTDAGMPSISTWFAPGVVPKFVPVTM